MSAPLHDIWDAASANPYQPFVPKSLQFTVGFLLLLVAFLFTGIFGLNRSLLNVPLLGVPAALAFGFGAVYMICAVGVYV